MDLKPPHRTVREKLLAVMESLKIDNKSELARMLEVGYRQLHRWLDEGREPSRAYRREIEDLYRRRVDIGPWTLAALRGLRDPARVLKENSAVREEFFVQMTYHSNAIEGSPMTEKDTRAVLHGQVVKGPHKDVAAHLEVVNHRNALRYLLETAGRGFRVTEAYVLKLNALVMSGFPDKKPGQYRDGYVNLTNTDVITPSAQEVPGKMRAWLKALNAYGKDPIAKVARDHFAFEIIHPFFDGNGRTGRLVMAAQLLSQGLPPAVIRIEDRQAYYMGLERGSLQEHNHLAHCVAEGVLKGYAILKGAPEP